MTEKETAREPQTKERISSREIKQKGRGVLKKHYLLLVIVCIVLGVLKGDLGISTEKQDEGITISTGDEEEQAEVRSENKSVTGSTGVLTSGMTASDVMLSCLTDGVEEGSQLAKAIRDSQIEAATDPALGRTRGVMATVVNTVSSGAMWVTIIAALRSLIHSETAAAALAIAGAGILLFLFYVFVREFYMAVLCRFFLESRTYAQVPYTRMLFFHKVKRWARVSLTLFVTRVFHTLWSLTLVGYFIKMYTYRLVPWIIAENPDIQPLEAITLSRRMMAGHKWDMFIKELSFIGWYLLGGVTFGLSDIFYATPYRYAALTEYYVWLRSLAKEKNIPGAEKLCDTWLYEKAPAELVEKTYADEKRRMSEPAAPKPHRAKALDILADWFGISLWRTPAEKAYEESLSRENSSREYAAILKGDAYPGRLSPIPEQAKNHRVEGIHYNRTYSLPVIGFLFLNFSFVGWLWEGTLHLLQSGTFVNRGVLHGPWIPIYGTGCILVLVLLKKLRGNPVLHFFATVLLCGCVEYFTGYFLEMTHGGQKWWDYSGYYLNLQGRVCFEGLLVFGIGGCLVIYLIAPIVDQMLSAVPVKVLAPVVAVLMCVFMVDNVYSSRHPNMGEGVTDIAMLEESPGEVSRMA